MAMTDEEAFEILNNFNKNQYADNGLIVVEYSYFPHSKKGKEFQEAFGKIFNDIGKYISIGNVQYQVVDSKIQYKIDNSIITTLINKHTENFAKAYLRFVESTNVNVQAGEVNIEKAEQVTIYADTINQIEAKRMIFSNEVNDSNNKELVEAVNRIEAELRRGMAPFRQDVSIVGKFAQMVAFAANIIQILTPFMQYLK